MTFQLPIELIQAIHRYADIDARFRLEELFGFQLSYKVQSSFQLPTKWWKMYVPGEFRRGVELGPGKHYFVCMTFRMTGRKRRLPTLDLCVCITRGAGICAYHDLTSALTWQRSQKHTKSLSTRLCRTQDHLFVRKGWCKLLH